MPALLLAACTGAHAEPSNPSSDSVPSQAAEPRSGTPAIALTVSVSRYGAVQAQTLPSASCTLHAQLGAGTYGDGPPNVMSATAAADGGVAWTYPTPLVPAGRGSHTVTCTDGARTAEAVSVFDVAAKTLDPKAFTVRIQGVDALAGLAGVSSRLDPSLVAARDADVARISATLESEWKLATRGLGAVTVVGSSADVPIYVVPGKGTSVHTLSRDGTQRVLIFAVDEFGSVTPENAVAVALHELGHIWCCMGPDAGSDGHWLAKIADPLLQGVDAYGLMTHPVTCLVGRGFESCPNRFSERELRTMGFTEIPAPPPDPCITQKNVLVSSLAGQRSTIDAQRAQLADLERQLNAIKAQYPTLVLPPSVFTTYTSLVDRYNALLVGTNANVSAYNVTTQQLNALPC